MNVLNIKYRIYDIDEHRFIAEVEVYDPYYLGIIVKGLGENKINMQIQPVITDTESCENNE